GSRGRVRLLCGRYGGFCSRCDVRCSGRDSCGDLEADGVKELMDVVDDALIQPIELGPLGRGKGGGAGDWSEESRGEGGVDALEEFQEDEADGVACLREAIASSVRELFDQ